MGTGGGCNDRVHRGLGARRGWTRPASRGWGRRVVLAAAASSTWGRRVAGAVAEARVCQGRRVPRLGLAAGGWREEGEIPGRKRGSPHECALRGFRIEVVDRPRWNSHLAVSVRLCTA